MERESVRDDLPWGLSVLLVILPIVCGGLLFLLFERGPIHDLGLFLVGAGILVGGALFLVRVEA